MGGEVTTNLKLKMSEKAVIFWFGSTRNEKIYIFSDLKILKERMQTSKTLKFQNVFITQRIHVWYIYLHIYNTLDPMGYDFNV